MKRLMHSFMAMGVMYFPLCIDSQLKKRSRTRISVNGLFAQFCDMDTFFVNVEIERSCKPGLYYVITFANLTGVEGPQNISTRTFLLK